MLFVGKYYAMRSLSCSDLSVMGNVMVASLPMSAC